MSEKKQHYKPIRNLAEINALFKNKPIDFNVADKNYALIYNPANYEVQLKAQTPTPSAKGWNRSTFTSRCWMTTCSNPVKPFCSP